jgi:hypothetical protein
MHAPERRTISTVSKYDVEKAKKRKLAVEHSKIASKKMKENNA